MIEINLLPGSPRKARRRRAVGGSSLKLPKIGGDRMSMFIIASCIIAPLAIGWMWWGTRTQQQELGVAIEGAVRDSARYAALRAANEELTARQDTIAQKLEIIQTLDGSRFVWAHVLDELSANLPPYIWLIRVTPAATSPSPHAPRIQVDGRAGNTYALTRYIQQLEASPFLRGVTLRTTVQIEEAERTVYSFTLEMGYEQPTPDAIQTVPLFAADTEVEGD